MIGASFRAANRCAMLRCAVLRRLPESPRAFAAAVTLSPHGSSPDDPGCLVLAPVPAIPMLSMASRRNGGFFPLRSSRYEQHAGFRVEGLAFRVAGASLARANRR